MLTPGPHPPGRLLVHGGDSAPLDLIRRLRVQAWATKGVNARSLPIFEDGHDRHALHWMVFDAEELVASARMCVHSCPPECPDAVDLAMLVDTPPPQPVASINRLVIAPEARGRGLAALLDDARIERARELGARSVVGIAGDGRVRQLLARGFMDCGAVHRQTVALPGHVLLLLLAR